MSRQITNKDLTVSIPVPKRLAFADVLSHPIFRSLWFGQICSQLAVSTTIFVLALRIYQTTGSSAAVSGLFLTIAVPGVLFGMIAGAVVDHMDKRVVLMLCDTLRALLAIGFLFYSGNIAAVYVLVFFYAAITQFYTPAEAPMIPHLVPESHLVPANSLFSFTFYSSLAVGSTLAGPVLRLFGQYGVFVLIAAFFLLAVLNNSRIPAEKDKRGFRSFAHMPAFGHIMHRVVSSVREGVQYVSTMHVLLDALLLLTGTQIILALLGTLGPAFAVRVLNIDIHDASIVLVGPAVAGIILGAIWVGNIGYRIGTSRLIKTGVLGAGIVLVGIALTVRLRSVAGLSGYFDPVILPIEIFLFFCLGVANSFLDVPANSILQKEAEGEMRGRVYGILTAAVGGVGMLPVVVSGILADVVGVGKVMLLLGLVVTGYGVLRMKYNTN
ncbi:MFS transporter [Patescibacteria group bacterium]|nr:MFS transporter [Patescibacteria group bacterium]